MNKIRKFLKTLGPGFISGAADDDPTAIAAYTQAGAQFGYHQLWTAVYAIPFMIVVQEMCGRIGLVTGKGLSGVIRKHYPKPILYLTLALLVIANSINIGADLGAMATSAQLIINLPFPFLLIGLTVFSLTLEVFLSYKTYSRFLKYLALTLLTYVGVAFAVKQDWGEIFRSTIIPTVSWDKSFILNLAAILGTNISPYLFFWQSDEEVEEEVEEKKIKAMGQGKPEISKKDIGQLGADTTVGMVFSNIVVFFITIAAASTLGRNGITSITTPAEAANALRPIVGSFSSVLFAIGIIGSGLLAVPVLAGSASYALSEAFGWKEGFYRNFTHAHGFYGIITLATLVGILVNFLTFNPFKLLIYSAAINALLSPVLLILIMLIANNEKILGKYTNSKLVNVMGVIITGAMAAASSAFILSFIMK